MYPLIVLGDKARRSWSMHELVCEWIPTPQYPALITIREETSFAIRNYGEEYK